MALIALGVRLSSPGPVLYRQERVTWNGERFDDAQVPHDAGRCRGGVPARCGRSPARTRATPFGAFLRRLSLDELPQLFNVLKGEMSLVGPRPERPEFVEQFRRQIPGYMQKHLVKAGITGWAQVNDLRGSTDLVAPHRIRPLLHRELVGVVRPAHPGPDLRPRPEEPQRALTAAFARAGRPR